MVGVDSRTEIREFLATRRARLSPEQAGVSVDYYTRMEKGHVTGVSDEVLDAVARALQLDDAERAHLTNLVRATRAARRPARRTKNRIRPSVQWALDAMTNALAFVRNGRMDILASNALGRALYSPVYDFDGTQPSIARFQVLDPVAHDFWPAWDAAADITVAIMRTSILSASVSKSSSLVRRRGEAATDQR